MITAGNAGWRRRQETGDASVTRVTSFHWPPSMHMSQTARAFTLIELVLCIAIIGILIAIILPAMTFAREAARKAECMSNQRQLGISLYIHMTESNDYVLPWYHQYHHVFPLSRLLCPNDPVPDVIEPETLGNEEPLAMSYAFSNHFGISSIKLTDIAQPSNEIYLFDGNMAVVMGSSSDDEVDTVGYVIDKSSIPWRVDVTHFPPGNRDNPQYLYNHPWPAALAHLAHGCMLGIWPVNTQEDLEDRIESAFMRRHMGRTVGNIMMLDGHVITRDRLFPRDIPEPEPDPDPGPPGGGPPGGGPPGGGPPGHGGGGPPGHNK